MIDYSAARTWIAEARSIVGFTGAGISTESGIPDFRSPGGVWSTARMIEFGEFISSRAARVEAWRQKLVAWPAMRDAEPNAGHRAFVELERRGQLTAMITQNIDRLHQRAGQSPELVIELHGTMTEAVCLSCGDRTPMDEVIARVRAGEDAPACLSCGGMLKTATVSFGQAMPAEEMERAARACLECDVILAVGSSLVVYPAASLPALAKQAGARLIIINRTPTPLDDIADLVINDEIGRALPRLIS
ncbi:MAG: Sir2 family NAD-dependent protein deacetylase [Blastocatellales bacterium]|nr:Sir2 family NAD-dependent protein deacetylase [Blastocatellales bacterium]